MKREQGEYRQNSGRNTDVSVFEQTGEAACFFRSAGFRLLPAHGFEYPAVPAKAGVQAPAHFFQRQLLINANILNP